jgi:hypothetical protein
MDISFEGYGDWRFCRVKVENAFKKKNPRSVFTGGGFGISVVCCFDLSSSCPRRRVAYQYYPYYRYDTNRNDERDSSHRQSDEQSESVGVK